MAYKALSFRIYNSERLNFINYQNMYIKNVHQMKLTKQILLSDTLYEKNVSIDIFMHS